MGVGSSADSKSIPWHRKSRFLCVWRLLRGWDLLHEQQQQFQTKGIIIRSIELDPISNILSPTFYLQPPVSNIRSSTSDLHSEPITRCPHRDYQCLIIRGVILMLLSRDSRSVEMKRMMRKWMEWIVMDSVDDEVIFMKKEWKEWSDALQPPRPRTNEIYRNGFVKLWSQWPPICGEGS